MIGLLRGRVIQRLPPQLLLDVNGVGYEVDAPMSTFYDLPAGDAEVTLHIHMVVREDAQILYGFVHEADRALFRALLKVNGVGGKMALAILSGMSSNDFSLCVQTGDVTALTKLPGVGKKTAERLIVEMSDRLDKLGGSGLPAGLSTISPTAAASSPEGDAISALLALGYKPVDASRMVKAVSADGLSTEDIIKTALQASVKRQS